jgi:hypothetical protein
MIPKRIIARPAAVVGFTKSRNLITDEIAERNRIEGEGGYTFNAYPPIGYEGALFTFAALRLGDHAHVEVETGWQIVQLDGQAHGSRSLAGHLILRWSEWSMLRDLLDSVPWARIAEVERPTVSQFRRHVP